MTHETDHHYIQETLAGNTQAFSVLVERYRDFVYTIALKMLKVREEAEEVAQDSFVKAYESLWTFRGDSKFSSWLYRIVYRKSLDRLRKHKKIRTLDLVEETTEAETQSIENALQTLEAMERSVIIQKGLEQLPEVEAAIVGFYYFEGLSVREISDITELTEDNIKIKLYRSRKKLFSYLKFYVLPKYTEENGRAT